MCFNYIDYVMYKSAIALMNVLLIEDNLSVLNELSNQLNFQGINTHAAESGQEGHYFLTNYEIDLVILDLGLPDEDGLVWLKRWRKQEKNLPILVLTARDNWADKVDGLNAGADDYLTKPFIFDELLARINALYRRSYGFSSSVCEVGELTLDMEAKSITIKGDGLELSAYEYKLLKCLLLNADKTVSKEKLRSEVYGDEYADDGNVITVLLGRIRKKIKVHLGRDPIVTIRNQGYKLCS